MKQRKLKIGDRVEITGDSDYEGLIGTIVREHEVANAVYLDLDNGDNGIGRYERDLALAVIDNWRGKLNG